MPDALMERGKTVAARRKTTFRALVVDALERSLEETKQPFELQDASVGHSRESGEAISNETINQAINAQRNPQINPVWFIPSAIRDQRKKKFKPLMDVN